MNGLTRPPRPRPANAFTVHGQTVSGRCACCGDHTLYLVCSPGGSLVCSFCNATTLSVDPSCRRCGNPGHRCGCAPSGGFA